MPVTIKNDEYDRFTLGATEMREVPDGYKLERSVLRQGLKSGLLSVPYGYTFDRNVRYARLVFSAKAILIGCCSFFGEDAKKLRQWAMATTAKKKAAPKAKAKVKVKVRVRPKTRKTARRKA